MNQQHKVITREGAEAVIWVNGDICVSRYTSAPAVVESAMGTKPKLATSVVVSTGRKRVMAPSRIASSSGIPR